MQDRRFPGGRRLAALFGRHGNGWLAHDSAHGSGSGQVPAAGWLGTSHTGLGRLRPAELADVLEGLSGPGRQELLASLDVEVAADALEEMVPGELAALLRDAGPVQAARLVTAMEPDEAVDALRGLPPGERAGLLGRMPPETRFELAHLLGYPCDQAGGIMTIVLACAHPGEMVEQVRRRLAGQAGHRTEIDSVAVLDESGRLAGDVPVFDLLVSEGGRPLADLIDPENPPVTLRPDAALDTVAATLMESRRSSLLGGRRRPASWQDLVRRRAGHRGAPPQAAALPEVAAVSTGGPRQADSRAHGHRHTQDQCALSHVTEDAGREDKDQPDAVTGVRPKCPMSA